jgi:triacylglycerol esterase/lipase EstA (alpha/beta hydrolase family)
MLARLQQFITLGLLALAAAWGVAAWRADAPGWAVGGVLLIVFGYAGVLAVEFALLQRVHGDDPTLRATRAQLLAAWWGEVWSAPAVFCWRQPFRHRAWPDHLPAAAGGRRGLLLVHGFVCNRGIWTPWLARLRELGVPYIAIDLEPVFGSIDDYMAPLEAAVQRLERHTGLAPVIVAHSMGGLAVRRWWSEHGDDERVHHAVTIGTPHHGTWLARFGVTRNACQMRQQSSWLQALAQCEPPSRAARFTCFYSHCDNIVFPPATATLAGADNRHLPGVAHVHMVDRPEALAEALRRLGVPPAP